MSALARRRQAADTPSWSPFAHDVLAGLSSRQKSIPCRWRHDARGHQLFERVTEQPEYYPARTEALILERCAAQIAQAAGPHANIVEAAGRPGPGTPILLAAMDRPQVLDFNPVGAWPAGLGKGRRVVLLLGAAIGRFPPDAAVALLDRVGRAAGPGALLVAGVSTSADPGVLLPAYDDAAGAMAAFNKHLLARVNRELEANFELSAFRHVARFNAAEQRVELHLMSEYSQHVHVLGHGFRFAMGETVHTGHAYPYGLLRFQALAHRAGWSQLQQWVDGACRSAVHVLERTRTA